MQVIIGKKKNMITRFDSRGNAVPVTVITATPNLVVGHRLMEKDGYVALQVGAGIAKKPKDPQKKGYKNLKFVPKTVREFRVKEIDDNSQSIGAELSVADFASGDLLKVTGTSRGKGFAGVVKRWGFAGGPRTHGQSDRERAPGSIGQTTTPGRVYKGKKMAGHTGSARKTVSGVIVYDVDTENNLILVRGAIPGAPNSLLLIEKVGSKKPLVEAHVEEQAIEEPAEEQVVETEAVEVENTAGESQEQVEEKSTEEGSETGETVVIETPAENSSDSPTPQEETDKEAK